MFRTARGYMILLSLGCSYSPTTYRSGSFTMLKSRQKRRQKRRRRTCKHNRRENYPGGISPWLGPRYRVQHPTGNIAVYRGSAGPDFSNQVTSSPVRGRADFDIRCCR